MKRISAKDNPLIKHINKLIKSSKYRAEQGEFIAEGTRLCEDALYSNCDIISLVVSDFACEHYGSTVSKLVDKAENSYVISDSIFSRISDTRNPQGVLCVIKALDNPTLFDTIKCNGKLLALDNIQDPSNLGTILRTARLSVLTVLFFPRTAVISILQRWSEEVWELFSGCHILLLTQ